MLVATRPRRRSRPSRSPTVPLRGYARPATLVDAVLREHADAGAMLGSAELEDWSDLAPALHALSREARDLARSLVSDSDTAPPAPVDSPAVVLARDLAVAHRILRRTVATPPSRAHCDMLAVSLARVAELRDAVGAALERARST